MKKRRGAPDRSKKGPPTLGLGKVLPPFVRDEIELTPEQEKQIADLERDVKQRLSKILTDEQKKKIESLRPKGPPDGNDRKGPSDDSEKKGPRNGKDGKRPTDDPEKKGPPDRKEKDDGFERPSNNKSPNEELPPPRRSSPARTSSRISRLTLPGTNPQRPADFVLRGDVEWVPATHARRNSVPRGVAFHSGAVKEGGRVRSGSISRCFRVRRRRGPLVPILLSGFAENNFSSTGCPLG